MDDLDNDYDEAQAIGVVLDGMVLKIEGAGVVGVENKIKMVVVNVGCWKEVPKVKEEVATEVEAS
jgi:hypothetical protein